MTLAFVHRLGNSACLYDVLNNLQRGNVMTDEASFNYLGCNKSNPDDLEGDEDKKLIKYQD